jgi:mannosyltransferase
VTTVKRKSIILSLFILLPMSSLQSLKSHTWLILLVICTLVSAYVRFTHLGSDGFWLDETITVQNVANGWLAFLNEPHHPPLLHLLTSLSIRILGESEFTARLPSAFFGILGIPLMAIWGRLIGYPRAALWAAFLLALSPFHLKYSQEARYYAILFTTSLLTYITLYFAVNRSRLYWWIGFALATVLNLYTHYAAFVVLATQLVWIGGWVLYKGFQRDKHPFLGVIVSSITIVLLYGGWFTRFLTALTINSGETATGGAGDYASVSKWIYQIFWEFGASNNIIVIGFSVLGLIGLLLCLHHRNYKNSTLIINSLIMPLILIFVFNIARQALPKYVIFILPFYLILIGIAIDSILHRVIGLTPQPKTNYFVPAMVVALIFSIFFIPLIQQEYIYVQEDWKGLVQDLENEAEDGDIFIAMALDLPNGYNQGSVVMPYYLERSFEEFQFIASNQLQTINVEFLKDNPNQVWFALLNRVNTPVFSPDVAQIRQFQGSLFQVSPTFHADALHQVITLYEQVIPTTVSPSPRCLLEHDLATLYVVAEEYIAAREWASAARSKCADEFIHTPNVYSLQNTINHGLIALYTTQGRLEQAAAIQAEAQETALAGLQFGVRDATALDFLVIHSLFNQFDTGQSHVEQGTSPIPIEKRRFSMPQNGEWGDVLLIHPGAQIHFRLHLPMEPTVLEFRSALDPQSWGWGGDGSTYVIEVTTAEGNKRELFRQHIGNTPADQRWHDWQVPLDAYSGQTIELTFFTEAGPTGDFTGDWAGWEGLRVLRH